MIVSGNASLVWKEATSDRKVLPVDRKTKIHNMKVSEEFNKTTTQTTRLGAANESIQI